jgi:hypothetical protein
VLLHRMRYARLFSALSVRYPLNFVNKTCEKKMNTDERKDLCVYVRTSWLCTRVRACED